MKFETEKYADVSTSHVTERDMEILEELADGPNINTDHDLQIYILTYREGAFVRFSPQIFLEELDEQGPKMLEKGLSQAFIDIIAEAAKQKIAMVRFDSDGQEVEDAPTFDW